MLLKIEKMRWIHQCHPEDVIFAQMQALGHTRPPKNTIRRSFIENHNSSWAGNGRANRYYSHMFKIFHVLLSSKSRNKKKKLNKKTH